MRPAKLSQNDKPNRSQTQRKIDIEENIIKPIIYLHVQVCYICFVADLISLANKEDSGEKGKFTVCGNH